MINVIVFLFLLHLTLLHALVISVCCCFMFAGKTASCPQIQEGKLLR